MFAAKTRIKRGRQTRENPEEAGEMIHDGSRPSSSSSSSSDGRSISSRSSSSEASSSGRYGTSSDSVSGASLDVESDSSSSSRESCPESGRGCGQNQSSEFGNSERKFPSIGREFAVENKGLKCSGWSQPGTSCHKHEGFCK